MMDEDKAEAERLKELMRMIVLDTPPERAYDDVTRMASVVCNTPISLISLIDADRQWFKSAVGLTARETPRHLAFCAHAIKTPEAIMVVPDALDDPRFVSNDLVTGEPKIRFYAGVPLVTSGGYALGTLCVIDRRPRVLTETEGEYLEFLAQEVVHLLEARQPKLSQM